MTNITLTQEKLTTDTYDPGSYSFCNPNKLSNLSKHILQQPAKFNKLLTLTVLKLDTQQLQRMRRCRNSQQKLTEQLKLNLETGGREVEPYNYRHVVQSCKIISQQERKVDRQETK